MNYTHVEDNVEITETYYLEYDGFGFPCDKEGNVDSGLADIAYKNLEMCRRERKCLGVRKFVSETRLCGCGSGKHPEDIYDARGIYVCRVCDDCRVGRLSKYRPDIFTDSNYWSDEDVDPD